MQAKRAGVAMATIGAASLLVVTACAPQQSPAAGSPSVVAPTSEYEEVQRQVAPIYKKLYPNLTKEDLAERESTAEVRLLLTEKWGTEDDFGGVHYDFENNSLEIYGTSPLFVTSAEAELRKELPAGSTLRLTTAVVRWSAKELDAATVALYTLLPPGDDYGATTDYRANKVAVILPKVYAAQAAELDKDARYDVTVVDTFRHGDPADG